MASERYSKIQKSILIILTSGFMNGVKSLEAPDLKLAVETLHKASVDNSNFHKSLKVLVERKLVMREDIVHEVWYTITPNGFDKAIELRNNN